MESTVPSTPDSFAAKANELAMSFDLTVDEAHRHAAVLQAIGAQWDPAVVLANEQAANELLYSGLDGQTQRIYDDLVAGVSSPAGGVAMVLPINPDADRSRRCCHAPPIITATAARTARAARNWSIHCQYLLWNEGPRVFMQCPTCAHLWTADTSRSDWRSATSAVVHRKGA